jgi:hypothetical protein
MTSQSPGWTLRPASGPPEPWSSSGEVLGLWVVASPLGRLAANALAEHGVIAWTVLDADEAEWKTDPALATRGA